MAHLTSFLAALLILSLFIHKIINLLIHRTHLRRHGCIEPPYYPHKNPILGLDHFANMMNALKNGRLLDFKKEQFDTYGKTFRGNAIGINAYYTSDPEVSKAVHATYAAKFGLQPLRYEVAKHLWGNGIIVTDGKHWQRGRALIRASFDVVHIANFDRLRRHTEAFLDLLPSDGATVDLMPLFKRLVRYL
jgi:cytochrome P450 monooxygenase